METPKLPTEAGQKTLEERQKNLEDLLREEAQISFGERIRDIGYNFKQNTGALLPLGIALGVAGLIAVDGCYLSLHCEQTSSYQEAYEYVREIKGSMQVQLKHHQALTLNPEMLEVPCRLLEEGSARIYAGEAMIILVDIEQNKKLFSPEAEPQPAIEYLGALKEQISDDLSETNKEVALTIGLIFGGLLGFLGLCGTAVYALEEWWSKSRLDGKKELQREVKEHLQHIRKRLKDNPHAERIYDLLDAMQAGGIKGVKLLESANALSEYRDQHFAPVLEVMIENPLKYAARETIKQAFSGYKKQFQKDFAEQRPAPAHAQLYLSLLRKGWPSSHARDLIEKVDDLEKDKPFFLEGLVNCEDRIVFSNVLSFYQRFESIDAEKRLQIVKYILEKGNRQLSAQLNENHIDEGPLEKYIENTDSLPNVGIRGLVKTLAKMNSALKDAKQNEFSYQDHIAEMRKIIGYRAEVDEGMVKVAQFLARHPAVPIAPIWGLLAQYSFFTDGDEYKSQWVSKELSRIEQQHPQVAEVLLDRKGERKFVQELQGKTELARYKAFNKAIDDLYYVPLDQVLGGERLRPEGLELSEELMNVLKGYLGIDYNQEEVQPLLREIIKKWVSSPAEAQHYIACLPGNKKLEEKVGTRRLDPWKNGLHKSYQVGLDENLKKLLREEEEREYGHFASCMQGLGQEFDAPKNIVELEKIYQETCRGNHHEDNAYLLEEAKHHLTNLKQKKEVLRRNASTITFYDSKDPIESMQMGIVSKSCTNIVEGINSFAAVVNTVDENKKIIYMADANKKKIGRTLAVLTNGGIVTYCRYENTDLDLTQAWADYFHSYAQQVGMPLLVPEIFTNDSLRKVLGDKGAKSRKISTIMHKAVCSKWYDDKGYGKVDIGDKGYEIAFEGYVLK